MSSEELSFVTEVFPALVADVVTDSRIVINRGAVDGIKVGQRLLLYEGTGREITDPETGKSLGVLEIPKGTGKVTHVLERMAVVDSDRTRRATMRDTLDYQRSLTARIDPLGSGPGIVDIPFDDPQIGDKVKPV